MLRTLALSAAVTTFLLIVLGSTVRVTHSGMGCPGWPLCYGQIGPVDRFHAAMEQSHRYLAAIVTVLVFLTAFVAWRQVRHVRQVLVPALVSAGVILLQVVLGAITVVTHNAPVTVALHLATGTLELGIAFVVTISVYVARRPDPARQVIPCQNPDKNPDKDPLSQDEMPGKKQPIGTSHTAPALDSAPSAEEALDARRLLYGASGIVATFIIIISGSLVVDSGAARACPSWPACRFGYAATPLVAIQLAHRGTVLLGSIVIATLLLHAWRRWKAVKGARLLAVSTAVALGCQVAVGAIDALLKAPAVVQDIHLAIAETIWVGVVCLASVGWYGASNQDEQMEVDGSPAGKSPADVTLKTGLEDEQIGTLR
ncbi:MAG: COX15/CtaA family protein [Acidimicrobiales bacterium]